MLKPILRMLQDEDGATTVDWVVLTAAIVGLGFAVIAPIGFVTNNAIEDVAGEIITVTNGITYD